MGASETVVVGAGPAGLAVAACLSARSVPHVLLEQTQLVGSSWHHHYRRLHLHTARAHSSLPLLPMPRDYPVYPSRAQVVSYLEDYAKHFKLAPRLGVAVRRIEPDGEGWKVSTDTQTLPARNVVITTGYNQAPVIPEWPGRSEFNGDVRHASQYLEASSYKGKRTLVVGAGNSGAEIALDLSENGVTTFLCIRSPINVMPRDLFGIPAQTIGVRLSAGPLWLKNWMMRTASTVKFGDLTRYGIRRSTRGPATQIAVDGTIPLIDIGTIGAIKTGAIKVVPGIERFTPTGVRCVGGEELALDAVVLATGYRTGLSGLLGGGATAVIDAFGRPVKTPDTAAPGLYFVGFKNPLTGFLRQIGIDAEKVASAISAPGLATVR